MKKIVTAIVVAGSLAGLNVFACGGMTQIKPPTMTWTEGSQPPTGASILNYEDYGALVLC